MPSPAASSQANRDKPTNPGIPYDPRLVQSLRARRTAIEAGVRMAVASGRPRRSALEETLLRAIRLIDLTTLESTDTAARVRKLCADARTPVPRRVASRLGAPGRGLHVAAVCVFPALVPVAVRELAGSRIPVATVAGGFPHGQVSEAIGVAEIRAALEVGADEVDVVFPRGWALEGRWTDLYGLLRSYREACGDAQLKVILGTGELPSLGRVRRAAWVAMMAGADMIKTSTGKEEVNATLPVGVTMARAIRDYERRTGFRVGLKAAGGIRTATQAVQWLALVQEILGPEAVAPHRFRIGASSLLADLRQRLVSGGADDERTGGA